MNMHEQREKAIQTLDSAISGDPNERRRFVVEFVDAILARPETPHATSVREEISGGHGNLGRLADGADDDRR